MKIRVQVALLFQLVYQGNQLIDLEVRGSFTFNDPGADA